MFSQMSPLSELLFIVGAVTTLVSFALVIYKIAKRIDAAIGVDGEGRSLSERMEKVEYQLWPNSGKSLMDRVNRLEETSNKVSAEIAIVKNLVTILVDSHVTNNTPKKPRSRRKTSE